MKKIISTIAVLLTISLFASVAFAAGSNSQGTQNLSNQGAVTGPQSAVQNTEQLQTEVQNREQTMTQEMQGMSSVEQKVYQNQNQVRLAVHALLSMENLTGGIGPQISAIAREFNNSVQATIRAEEKIQSRNALVKFFMGGDKEAAGELEQETVQNQARILELKQLKDQCQCDDGVKTMLQEQIQNMEQEQIRLGELAQKEKQKKGLFGWFSK